MGDVLDGATKARESQADEHEARHDGGNGEPVHSVLLHDVVHDDDERAGRAPDLHSRATQRGNDEPRNDRGKDPALGRHTAGDRECDGQRERHDADDHAGAGVGQELGAGVSA